MTEHLSDDNQSKQQHIKVVITSERTNIWKEIVVMTTSARTKICNWNLSDDNQCPKQHMRLQPS